MVRLHVKDYQDQIYEVKIEIKVLKNMFLHESGFRKLGFVHHIYGF